MPDYVYMSSLSVPYGTCWNFDTYGGGTQFARRADSWSPVYEDDKDYRCLPDPLPAEFQVWNEPPPCSEARCSGHTCGVRDVSAADMAGSYDGIAVNSGQCIGCKKDLLALLAGYAWDKDVPNPLLYPPAISQ